MEPPRPPRHVIRTRGAAENPASRFDRLVYLEEPLPPDPEAPGPDPERPPTRLLSQPTGRPFGTNESPDLAFDTSLNPYRGCEHGCSYCFARPTHEFLGFSAGLDFETRIVAKRELAERVREELSRPGWRPQVVAVGAVTDAYQPIERRLGLTRRCLEVFAEFRNPIAIVTKSALVTRDIDLLGELARHSAAQVLVSITTLDAALQRDLEPRAAPPARRLAAVSELAGAGIPVGVMVAPVIPGLTDHESPAIVAAAAEAGALSVRSVMLKLPHGVKEIFSGWLERHRPERRDKVLARVRSVRGGRLNDPRFHHRQRGRGFFAQQHEAIFALALRRAGLPGLPELSTAHFRRPSRAQLDLFDDPALR